MKVRLFTGGPDTLAIIKTDTVELNVLLEKGMPPDQAMRNYAAELREQAIRKLRRADLISEAAQQLFPEYCCEKGEAQGKRVCDECAEISAGYQSCLGVASKD